MPKLVILQGGQAIPKDLTLPETTLGRLAECDIQLDSNMVSRKHARLVRKENRHAIVDLGSGNGTFVNGQRISDETTLKHGDRLKLGPILLRYETDETQPDMPVVSDLSSQGSFQIDVDGENNSGTIMGTIDNTSGFGLLDVRSDVKLKAIIEISRSLAGTTDVEALLPKILDTLFNIFPHADRGCILLRDETTKQMIPQVIKHRKDQGEDSLKISRTILNAVIEERKGILSADAASDARFEASESISNLTIRSMMCVPMLNMEGQPMGIINIDTQNPVSQFKQDDLDLLLAVAGQAALSYETARLMVTYAEKEKQDNEMRIARNVQHSLLPEVMPEIEGYEFYASYESAQEVGGDYYDIIELENDKICVAFGDVAGKGVPAALVMSRLSSVVRSTMAFVEDVARATHEINNHMCAKAVEGRFVTFLLMVLDLKTNELSVVNAGHMSPMILKCDKQVEEFSDDLTGIPIGVMEDFPYDSAKRVIEPGEKIVLYTDGVSEAMNHENVLYEIQQIRDFVCAHSGSAEELGQALVKDVKRHAAGRPQNDDITLMTFGRN